MKELKKLRNYAAIRIGEIAIQGKKLFNENISATEAIEMFSGDDAWIMDLVNLTTKNTMEIFDRMAEELDQMNDVIVENNKKIDELQKSIDEMKKMIEKK